MNISFYIIKHEGVCNYEIISIVLLFHFVCKRFDFFPNVLLEDEDDEQEESSQHVEAVNDPEEDTNEAIFLTRLAIVVVDDEMDTFNDPQNTEDEEKFGVENLER